MKSKVQKFYQFIFVVCFPVFIYANEIHIVFSRSLNGNLLSCPCAVVPIAGISRRASFLEKNFSNSDTIFLELGNFFSSSDSQEKRKAILEAFTKLNYVGLTPSTNEWNNLVLNDWKELNSNLILVSNVKEKGWFINKNLFSEKKLIIKHGKKFLISSILSELEFLKISSSIRKYYELIPPKNYVQNFLSKEDYDYLILILIGNLDQFNFEDFSMLNNPIFFLAPSTPIFSKNPELLHPKLGKVYTINGNFGNELGVLKLNLKTNSLQVKTIQLDVDKLEDATRIKKIAEQYGIQD